MHTPLQITFRDLSPSPALEERIRERLAKLTARHPELTKCRVTIEARRRQQLNGRHFSVRLDMRVPACEAVVSWDDDADVYVALREAFAAAARRLEDLHES